MKYRKPNLREFNNLSKVISHINCELWSWALDTDLSDQNLFCVSSRVGLVIDFFLFFS